MMHLPVWFKSLVYSELVLQLPFFFVASYAFIGAWFAGVFSVSASNHLLPVQPALPSLVSAVAAA